MGSGCSCGTEDVARHVATNTVTEAVQPPASPPRRVVEEEEKQEDAVPNVPLSPERVRQFALAWRLTASPISLRWLTLFWCFLFESYGCSLSVECIAPLVWCCFGLTAMQRTPEQAQPPAISVPAHHPPVNRERANSIPKTPMGKEKEIYPFYCPICFHYFRGDALARPCPPLRIVLSAVAHYLARLSPVPFRNPQVHLLPQLHL